MIVDGFDEPIGEFLHFAFRITQLILGQLAGGFQFLCFVDGRAPDTRTPTGSHGAEATRFAMRQS